MEWLSLVAEGRNTHRLSMQASVMLLVLRLLVLLQLLEMVVMHELWVPAVGDVLHRDRRARGAAHEGRGLGRHVELGGEVVARLSDRNPGRARARPLRKEKGRPAT